MKNLKISLCFKFFIIFILLNTYFITTKKVFKTNYKKFNLELIGYIKDYNISGNHLKLIVKGKEKVIVNYYFTTLEELNSFNLKLGDLVKLTGVFEKPSPNRTFNLFNYENYLLSKKIYWTFKASNIIKIKSNTSLLNLTKEKLISKINKLKYSSHYVQALILGDKTELDPSVIESYQKNGVSHLLAISGSHISFFILIVNFILKKLKKSIKNFLLILILMFYLFLTSFPTSLLRAVFFYILILVNKEFKFNFKNNELLVLLAGILLLYNPYYIYDIGFLFSFIISFYLVSFKDIFNTKSFIKKLLLVSVVSFLVSIPILINNFFEINFLSPIINLIYVPQFIFFIFPLCFLVLLVPILDKVLYLLIMFSEKTSKLCLRFNFLTFSFSKIGIIFFIIYFLLITYILIEIKKRNFKKIIYLIIVLFIHYNINYLNKYPIITFLDVGQGDSILIQLPFNKGSVLVDTGGIVNFNKEDWKKQKPYSIGLNTIIPYMKSVGVKKLNYLILTHGDFDHVGEAINIMYNFKVANIIFNSAWKNDLEHAIIKEAKKLKINYYFFNKNKLKIKDKVLYFLNKKNIKNENEDSLIVYTKLNNYHILLLGDAGIETENFLMDEYNLPKMDILKVGHHGSKNSSSINFLKVIEPKYSFISVGINNRFNHPHPEVINNLEKVNSKYYLTSLNGSIKVILKENILIKKSLDR